MKAMALATFFVLTIALSANAEDTVPPSLPPCSVPEFRQFDFWLGDWDLTWSDTAHGHNTITSVLGDCVIEENFTTGGDSPFQGKSVSTYNARAGQWRQTWVDNTGAYLEFAGGLAGDSMILSRESTDASGNVILQRMVWLDIRPNSLTWHWERSTDAGATWQTLWAIEYKRR